MGLRPGGRVHLDLFLFGGLSSMTSMQFEIWVKVGARWEQRGVVIGRESYNWVTPFPYEGEVELRVTQEGRKA